MRLNWFLFKKFMLNRKGNRYLSLISLFAIIGLSLGVCALIVVMSVMKGFQHQIKSKLRNISPDYLVTLNQRPSALDLHRFREALSPKDQLMHTLTMKALLIHKPLGQTAMDFRIVDEAYYSKLRPFMSPKTRDPSVVIGAEAARRLLLAPGDQVTFLLPGVFEDPLKLVPKKITLRIGAIIQTKVYAVDEHSVFIPSSVLPFNTLPSYFEHGLNIFGSPQISTLDSFKSHPKVVSVQAWEEQNKLLYFALWLEALAMNICLTLIILVALSSIMSLLYIFFSDRKFALSILMCLGLSPYRLFKLSASFGAIIGVIGVALGLAMSAILLTFLHYSKTPWLPNIYYNRQFPVHIDPVFILIVIVGSFIASLGVSAWVSRSILKERLLDHLTDTPVI